MRRDDSRFVRWFDDDGARTIAKQNASTAIIPVDQFGNTFGAHNQSTLGLTRLDEFIGSTQGVNKPGTGSLETESCASRNTQLVLNDCRNIRKNQIRRRRSSEDHVDFGNVNISIGDRFLSCLDTHV